MIRFNDLIDSISGYMNDADLDLIEKAYVFSAMVHKGQVRLSGEPYLNHPLEVTGILTQMKLDMQSLTTGLLHDTVEDTLTTLEEIEEKFGKEIAQLVDGVTKISKISFRTHEEEQAENFRKMLLAMSRDIRVILVKLADRLHNMRTLEYHPRSSQIRIAQETLDIYAPLAHRLGIAWIKSELEDLALKYIHPDIYDDLVNKVIKGKEEREKYIQEVIGILEKNLSSYGLNPTVFGRPKHYYSIYWKMKTQRIDFDQVYDLIAFRIILKSIKECYEALGYIHSMWTPIPGKVKDHIAMPKANMYQSLHSTVIGPYGERIEIQIRSVEMDRTAEYGIAAHWKYKEGKAVPAGDGEELKFAWLRQLLDWQKEFKDPKEFIQMFKVDLFPDEVYVFTPRGEVKQFPKGASPIDFAYSIHTDIGQQCIGAKVNGKIVPLKYQLQSGDIIEIITASDHRPSWDWLNMVKTSRARAKIRQWIKGEEQKRSLSLGREICEKEFRRYGLNFSKLLKSEEMSGMAKEFGLLSIDELIAQVGYGKISPRSLIGKLLPNEKLEEKTDEKKEGQPAQLRKMAKGSPGGILIKGIPDVLVHFARCCSPLPGDEIQGFITRGRGVTIHAIDCPNILRSDSQRLISAQWDLGQKAIHPARVKVVGNDERGLLAEISSSLSSADVNITNAHVETTVDKKALCIFGIEVNDLKHLEGALKALRKIKNVIQVERLRA
jgi:GTP pyrophosphokinase